MRSGPSVLTGLPLREEEWIRLPPTDSMKMIFRLLQISLCAQALALIPALASGAAPGLDDPTFFRSLNLDRPELHEVRKAVESTNWPAASAAYLAYRRSLPREGWTSRTPGSEKDAQSLLRGTVKNWALPGKALQMPDPHNFDWRANPLPPSDPSYSREVPLATARTLFWIDLAAAYRATGDEKYASFWAENLTDFVKDNPVAIRAHPEHEVAWRALETGIRMAGSWPDAYFAFLDSQAMTPAVHTLFAKSVYEHGLRLDFCEKNHPERGGNHVVSEAAGLMAAGTLFPEFEPAGGWRRTALARLATEVDRQVYPDGFQGELSPLYHLGVLEDFLGARSLAALAGDQVPEPMESRLREMFRVLCFLQDGDGIVPPLNDSPSVSAREVAARGLKFFDDPLLRFTADGKLVDGLPPASGLLEWPGMAVMRSQWGNRGIVGLFYAGPVPVGHWHQDKLQFLLWAFGRPMLVDPGKMAYDQSPLRRYSIGTESHNTLTVDGRWQYRDATDGRRMAEAPAAMSWLSTGWLDFSSGKYDEGYWDCPYMAKAYRPFEKTGPALTGVAHHRTVLFLKPVGFLIVDNVQGVGTHRCDVRFNVDAENLEVDSASRAVFASFPGGARLKVLPVGAALPEVTTARGRKDPPAGWLFEKSGPRPVFQLIQTQTAALPVNFANWLEPSSEAEPSNTEVSRADGPDDLSAYQIRNEKEEWLVHAAPSGALVPMRGESYGTAWHAMAEAVVVHRSGAEVSTAFYGTSFETAALALRSQSPCALEIKRLPQQISITNAGVRPATLEISRPTPHEICIEPGKQITIAASAAVADPSPKQPSALPSPDPSAPPPAQPALETGGFWEWLKGIFQ